ncbi:hypothetical protein EYY60_15005 [Flavobacterium zhairuonense]|nr:hypothetical protein [Flavobacterium zhairuonense]KAF2508437.1 hypothetical protein EYY60_15005 [Flavobacterium zhairuonense]
MKMKQFMHLLSLNYLQATAKQEQSVNYENFIAKPEANTELASYSNQDF